MELVPVADMEAQELLSELEESLLECGGCYSERVVELRVEILSRMED